MDKRFSQLSEAQASKAKASESRIPESNNLLSRRLVAVVVILFLLLGMLLQWQLTQPGSDKAIRGSHSVGVNTTDPTEYGSHDHRLTEQEPAQQTSAESPVFSTDSAVSGHTGGRSVESTSVGPEKTAPVKEPETKVLPIAEWNWSIPDFLVDDGLDDMDSSYEVSVFFQPEQPKLKLSGRLVWDESDEAYELSVQDSIRGAEFEISVPLP